MARADEIEAHYAGGALRSRTRPGTDELHVRGREATLELAALAELREGERVLDVGAGLGGPARTLAERYGVRVVGVDLTAAFVEAARELTRKVGLDDRIEFVHADALALPFPDDSFDVAWTQHAAMNVPDKAGLYAELHRVVRPGGRLAVYDVVAGAGGEPEYPLPWASRRELSFLVSAEELRRLLEGAGFRVGAVRDVSDSGRAWSQARAAEEAGPAFANLGRALEDGRLELVQLVAATDGADG
ncbi:MAG TPA: methyltransferase domain-containing protein [Gaiellaceae bacterium]|nr:methyltransferase domain-containing protein [Gaiellaceae bacterium]